MSGSAKSLRNMVPNNPPTPEQVKQARKDAGLTQSAAGALVHVSERTWQKWEHGERHMSPAVWELFQIKVKRKRR